VRDLDLSFGLRDAAGRVHRVADKRELWLVVADYPCHNLPIINPDLQLDLFVVASNELAAVLHRLDGHLQCVRSALLIKAEVLLQLHILVAQLHAVRTDVALPDCLDLDHLLALTDAVKFAKDDVKDSYYVRALAVHHFFEVADVDEHNRAVALVFGDVQVALLAVAFPDELGQQQR